jgi:lysophospholipase L1-like esterase
MPPYLAFFLDGRSFITGNLLMVVGLGLFMVEGNRRWPALTGRVLCLIGIVLVGVSAIPVWPWLYALWGMLAVAGLAVPLLPRRFEQLRTSVLLAAMIGIACFLVFELPSWQAPKLSLPADLQIHVIGDSLSAGIGKEKPWPARLSIPGNHPVTNAAIAGATTATAMRQAEALPAEPSLVLLEIGGNDLLYGTSADDFGRDLDALLTRLKKDNRIVIIFELPLPPGSNGYGLQQRRLADKHGCLLIPRYYLARILCFPGNTCDGLHLSNQGHQMLADSVARIFDAKRGNP